MLDFRMCLTVTLFAALCSIPSTLLAQVKPEVDAGLTAYQSKGGAVTGKLAMGTSETMRRLMDQWVTGFTAQHKGTEIKVDLITNAEGPRALAAGTFPILEGADLVGLSYPLQASILDELKTRSGRRPIEVPVALDALVLVVHHRNPLSGLTLPQVRGIFADPGSPRGEAERWGDVGVQGTFGPVYINRYGRDTSSGTFSAFRAMALEGAAQRSDVHPQPGSMSVVMEVGTDEAGIGYAATGFARRSRHVRVVPIAKETGAAFITPTNETVVSGEYPLRRELFLYVVPGADGQVSALAKEFLAFVLSRDGQQRVLDEGFVPLPAGVAGAGLDRVRSGQQVASSEVTTVK